MLAGLASHYTLSPQGKTGTSLDILMIQKAASLGHGFQLLLAPKTRLEESHQLLCQTKLFIRTRNISVISKQICKHLAQQCQSLGADLLLIIEISSTHQRPINPLHLMMMTLRS